MILQDHSAALETLGEASLTDIKAGGLTTSNSDARIAPRAGSGPPNSQSMGDPALRLVIAGAAAGGDQARRSRASSAKVR